MDGSVRDAVPASLNPPRPAVSVRRTTSHTCARHDGLHGPVTVTAVGRDLHTDVDGSGVVLDKERLRIVVDFTNGEIKRLESSTDDHQLDALRNTTAFSGFRRALAAALPHDQTMHTVRHQLLDDLPIALLLSGRVLKAGGVVMRNTSRRLPVDLCAGLADGSTAMRNYTPDFGPPLVDGPVAPDVNSAGDDQSWHAHDAAPADSTVRRRRLDTWIEGDVAHVDSLFRDSHVDSDSVETVVHEYALHATLDLGSGRITACDATPGHLPYPECPSAATSAERIIGLRVDDLRASVLRDITGAASCTHLNDAMRAIDGVGALLPHLGVGIEMGQDKTGQYNKEPT